MPNHFHWLLVPNEMGLSPSRSLRAGGHGFRCPTSPGTLEVPGEVGQRNPNLAYQQKLSQQIGTLLSSYTKAINKRHGRSGSLFRSKTKYKNGMVDDFITLGGMHRDKFFQIGNHYAIRCFNYIHQNPVKAGLVRQAEEWEFSSARDYAGLRQGTLCNYELARGLIA